MVIFVFFAFRMRVVVVVVVVYLLTFSSPPTFCANVHRRIRRPGYRNLSPGQLLRIKCTCARRTIHFRCRCVYYCRVVALRCAVRTREATSQISWKPSRHSSSTREQPLAMCRCVKKWGATFVFCCCCCCCFSFTIRRSESLFRGTRVSVLLDCCFFI